MRADTVVATGGTVLAAGSTLVSGIVLSRALGTADFGRYSLAFALASTIAMGARVGMDRAGVRLMAEALADGADGAVQRRVIGIVVRIALVGALFGALAAFGASALGSGAFFDDDRIGDIAPLIGVWTAAETIHIPVSELHRGRNDIIRATGFGRPLRNLLVMVFVSAAWLADARFATMLWLSIAATALAAGLAGASLARRTPSAGALVRGERLQYGEVLRVGVPLMLSGVGAFVIATGDGWLVGSVADATEVGLYGAALRLSSVVAMPLIVINAIVSPTIVRLYRSNELTELESVVRRATTTATIPLALAAAIIVGSGEPLLELIFGGGFGDAAAMTSVLVIGQSVNVAMGPCGTVLNMTGHERASMMITLVAAATMVVVILLGRSVLDPVGVAVVAVAASIGQNVALVATVRATVGVRTYAGAIR